MIPKQIWTIWIGDKEMPDDVKGWVETQKIPGYKHTLLTLDLLPDDVVGHWYVKEALLAKRWVKAVDFIRMYYLFMEGGWFLDADVSIMPGKNFDYLLDNKIVAAREANGWIGCAVMGAVQGQPFIDMWADEVLKNFRGDDDKNFESSMELLTKGFYEKDWPKDGFSLIPTKVLYPFDHQKNTEDIQPGTITYHHFLKSWV